MPKQLILAIDQGTSSTKTLIIDQEANVCAQATEPLKTHYLDNGWVEQDPEDLLQNVLVSVKKCVEQLVAAGYSPKDIAACGISNQRETFVVWDKQGKPLYNAVVWQCKRSVEICSRLKADGLENTIKRKTGLIIDPYFSGTKLLWLYENVDAVRKSIDAGEAYFGTVDTWLLYKLTNGLQYATDYTNASRTLFFNLTTLTWDWELLEVFGLSNLNLPECRPSAFSFGESTFRGLLDQPLPIAAMIGDSHSAAFGEGCFQSGTAKATMGTGCSILMNIGEKLQYSDNGLMTTICWSTADTVQYALEGVIVTCGATIEWLKNELGLFTSINELEAMATAVADNGGVYLIPAFSGLGAPHWDMSRKASIVGLTFGSTKNHIVRAALESIPFQIKDVIVAMEADTSINLQQLMVNGGISTNRFIVQFLADLLNKPVASLGMPDVSALGAAYLAGLQQKIFKDIDHLPAPGGERKLLKPSQDSRIGDWHKEWQGIITNGQKNTL